MTESDVVTMLKAKATKAGSAEVLAEEWNVSPTYIRMVLGNRANPGKLILAKLGLERVVSYRIKKEGA